MGGRRWRWLFRVVFGVAIGIATGILGYYGAREQAPQPPPSSASDADTARYLRAKEKRENTNTAILISAVVCAFAATREIAGGLVERYGEDRSEAFCRKVENELGSLWRTIAKKHDPAFIDRLGLHVWLVPRWHWRLAPPSFKESLPDSVKLRIPTPAMWRPGKLRHVDHVDPSGIRWRRGRGVIGRCWLERRTIKFDVDAKWGQYAAVDKDEWRSLRRSSGAGDLCMKLNFKQFTRLREDYSEVVAVPLYKRRGNASYLVGCVVADMPALAAGQHKRVTILNRRFEVQLQTTARQIERIIKD